MDDPRYFSSPERFNAGIIWFTSGYVEYRFPNQLHSDETAKEIQISMELCSEAPGVLENYPSDIYFYVNDIELGCWTSPGNCSIVPEDLLLHGGIKIFRNTAE